MPELPEEETVRRGIAPYLTGRKVTEVELLHPRVNREQGSEDLASLLPGHTIYSVERRGKYLWLELDAGASRTDGPGRDRDRPVVFIHLGMSGQLRVGEYSSPHVRLRARLDDGSTVCFVDQRTFGYWRLAPLSAISHIAPDPLSAEFDSAAVARAIRKRKSPVKSVLLNQEVVSGIGNIYADETLWAARVHPKKRASALRQKDAVELVAAARAVLAAALERGGTSFDSLYVNVNGESGRYGQSLAAYGRAGQPCLRCATPLKAVTVGGRTTTLCPRCQGY